MHVFVPGAPRGSSGIGCEGQRPFWLAHTRGLGVTVGDNCYRYLIVKTGVGIGFSLSAHSYSNFVQAILKYLSALIILNTSI